ncbi:prepilin peptidase [Allonocardiopsis opalescens]|uniref:Leader peptidase (Prepilin peptidase)/N-methyltransferase n=1 Tax=Allonocardiopsis opalescens TaxID=1144618 RepID=A0A2T0Q3S6_9ACTN|nr:A24 family peptidase [Allonocardiopsis opalescens]PRX98460.1 leader peptidase (prepilin peptidase)/N-methyltransferase [Allonocardiopsis opalescens]
MIPLSAPHLVTGILTALVGAGLGPALAGLYPLFRATRPDDEEPPPGSCPRCAARVAWREPRTVLRAMAGRCHSCGEPIRRDTVGITIAAAAVLGLLGLRFGPAPELPAYLFLGAVAVLLTFIDARVKRLPDMFTLPAYPVALLLLAAAAPFAHDGWAALLSALAGLVGLGLFYGLLWFIYPAGMGFGDVKLSGLLGLYLGWLGLGAVLYGAFAGFLFGTVVGVVLIALGRATRRSAIPFGPYMIIGTLAVVLASPLLLA